MGLFDWFEPTVTLICPHCGAGLKGWQGKDGPCELLVWSQGERGPVGQRVDDDIRWSAEELKRFRLPARFLIYTTCCNPRLLVYAICTATDGVWTETRLLEPEDVEEWFSDEPKDRRAAMRARLQKAKERRTGKRKQDLPARSVRQNA